MHTMIACIMIACIMVHIMMQARKSIISHLHGADYGLDLL